ncbi:MAG: lamin tail domain-containing protein [Fibrobacterota bacterium]|nr:lamin tail domain-containing protein [Fibrobacterota bacterium]
MFKKRLSILLLPLFPFLVLPVLEGCLVSGRSGKGTASGAEGASDVRLVLTPAALVRGGAGSVPALDSVHVRVSAEDMAPMDFSFSGDSLAVTMEGLPAGSNRLVSAYLFRAGTLLYSGQGTFAFRREMRMDAALRCEPQFSRVTAAFHLPVHSNTRISSGLLKLTGASGEFSAPLLVKDEFGSFRIDELPGGTRYDVTLSLTDSLGKVRYQADRAGVFLPLGEEAKWDMSLVPSEAMAGLSITLGSPKEAILETSFPSRLRRPSGAGEVIVSEFYAAPGEADSSSQGEWWEVFNRTADSLVLGGCRLARDRSIGATRSYSFDSTLVLGPGKALVFGRAAAPADVHYGEFSLVNTASSLLILCAGDSLVVDSLRYSSVAADSTSIPMRENAVTSLDAGQMSRRGEPASWCLVKSGAVGELAPTPGRLGACLDGG